MTNTCKICWEQEGVLVAPCACTGTMKFVHLSCLMEWLRVKGNNSSCDICVTNYLFQLPLKQVVMNHEPLPLSLKCALVAMWTYVAFIMMLPFILVRPVAAPQL